MLHLLTTSASCAVIHARLVTQGHNAPLATLPTRGHTTAAHNFAHAPMPSMMIRPTSPASPVPTIVSLVLMPTPASPASPPELLTPVIDVSVMPTSLKTAHYVSNVP